MVAAALVTVAAAAVRMHREGMGHVASIILNLQVRWERIRILQLHSQMDHTISCTRKIAVTAPGGTDYAAKDGHMADNRVRGQVGRHTRHSNLSEGLIRGPAIDQGAAGGCPGHTGPQGGQGRLIHWLSFHSN
jgi:hypothetical protein